MESNKGSGNRWLLALPVLLICLPCALPTLAVAVLAVGGVGAIGSFLAGTGGALLALGGTLLVAVTSASLARKRWRCRQGRSARSAV